MITTFIVIADARTNENKDVELGLFFNSESAGAFIERLVGHWQNIRLIERQSHVDELHSAHHPLFLCSDCIKKKGRPDAVARVERPKGFTCHTKH